MSDERPIVKVSALRKRFGDNEVLKGIDIDIRAHNRAAIEAHPMASRIRMIEGSSIAPDTVRQVREAAQGHERVLVTLDSHPDRTLGVRGMDCTVIAHEKTAQAFHNRPNTFKAQGDETGANWEAIPGLGIRFHEQGLAHGWQRMANFLSEAQARGLVRDDADCFRAAQHLIGMFHSGCYQRHLMSDSGSPDAATIAADVDAAVDAFCRAYGAVDAAG